MASINMSLSHDALRCRVIFTPTSIETARSYSCSRQAHSQRKKVVKLLQKRSSSRLCGVHDNIHGTAGHGLRRWNNIGYRLYTNEIIRPNVTSRQNKVTLNRAWSSSSPPNLGIFSSHQYLTPVLACCWKRFAGGSGYLINDLLLTGYSTLQSNSCWRLAPTLPGV